MTRIFHGTNFVIEYFRLMMVEKKILYEQQFNVMILELKTFFFFLTKISSSVVKLFKEIIEANNILCGFPEKKFLRII